MKILLSKDKRRINTLELQLEEKEQIIKDELYKSFMDSLEINVENKKLKTENKRLRAKIKELKEIIKEG